MLSRTAARLFWTGRYVERADFVARLIDATLRLASLPSTYGWDSTAAWSSALAAAAMAASYAARTPRLSADGALDFMALDPGNPSSIRCCIEHARGNARTVRSALSPEAWETLNGAWHAIERFGVGGLSTSNAPELIEATRHAALVFAGSVHHTMLRGDAYWFLQLGAAVERADNTARLLDQKYHLVLPQGESVGGSLDYFQWSTILRTVSALSAYHWFYRDGIRPWLVADLLIFNAQMPRSLVSCYQDIALFLDNLTSATGRRGPAQRIAGATLTELQASSIDAVFAAGLHEFLGRFILDNNRLGEAVAQQFMF